MTHRNLWALRSLTYRLAKGLRPLETVTLVLCLFVTPARADDRYGLIFVYRTDCPASRAFSYSLKAVAEHYTMAVLAVSQDTARFEEWPQTRPDAGQSARLNITRVPYLALFDQKFGRLAPVTVRYLTPAQLEQRLANILETLP